MSFKKNTYLLLSLICMNQSFAFAEIPPKRIEWKVLEKGLYLAEVKAPRVTRISDAKVTILKIDPTYFSFHLVMASEHDSLQRSVKEWSEMCGLVNFIKKTKYLF